jgi:hypothetical protein
MTAVDGSLTNATVLRDLPPNTTLIGRIRRDAKLYHLPGTQPPAQGRRRAYGRRAPTPEALRQDETHPWQPVSVFFGGETRTVRAKQLGPLRWRTAGEKMDLQLIVLAPTPYRLSPNAKLLYRHPTYLICTDPAASLHDVIQHYLWRWDIETNFRDEKTLLGLGEAQIRTPAAVQNVTATAVAAYAMLLTADASRTPSSASHHLPPPKWHKHRSSRTTTASLIQSLRYELWAHSINSSAFSFRRYPHTKPQKSSPALDSALFYATRSS